MVSLCHELFEFFLCPEFDTAQKLQQEIKSNKATEVFS